MSTDEFERRITRLTERHEALTEVVEHIARQGEQQNGPLDRVLSIVESLAFIVPES
jgi:hypothetical protein